MKKIIPVLCTMSILLTSCFGNKGGKTPVVDIIKNSPIEGEITVSCYDVFYGSYLKTAAVGFERKFPGTKINIEVFGKHPEVETGGFDDGASVSRPDNTIDEDARNDYRYKTAAQLMAGKGADIYALDILPVHKYLNGGYFENLREYMEGDPGFDMTKYRENIFDALTVDNKQFVMPLDYQFSCFFYNKKLFSASQGKDISALTSASYGYLAGLAQDLFINSNENAGTTDYMFGYGNTEYSRKALTDREMFEGMFAPLGFYNGLFYYNYDEFINAMDKKANFTDGKFIDMLNKIGGYADLGYIKAYANRPGAAAKYKEALSEDSNEDFFISPRWSFDISNMLLYQETEDDLYSPPKRNEYGFAGIISNDKGEVPFQYKYAFGINENSENKKTAWEFIKYLLSDEEQIRLNSYIPVNKNAFINSTKKRLSPQSLFTPPEKIVLTESEKQIFDEYTALIDKYTEQINTYIYVDPIVLDMVEVEADAYFNGEKTAEDIARILQGKLTLYLSE